MLDLSPTPSVFEGESQGKLTVFLGLSVTVVTVGHKKLVRLP